MHFQVSVELHGKEHIFINVFEQEKALRSDWQRMALLVRSISFSGFVTCPVTNVTAAGASTQFAVVSDTALVFFTLQEDLPMPSQFVIA